MFRTSTAAVWSLSPQNRLRMSSNPLQTKLQSKLELAKEMSDEEKLYRFNGVLYPSLMCPEPHLKALGHIRAREEDLLLVAYPKCGE